MLNVEMPWVFYLLPLPLIVYWLFPKASQQQTAVLVPFYQNITHLKHTAANVIKQRGLRLLSMILIWLSVLCSAANPIWIGDPITLPTSGRDLLLAVDLSGSMETEDMVAQGQQIPRINAVKVVLNDFIQRREGDRLGLILFGTQAYVQAPLTFDRNTVQQFLLEAKIGFAGADRTAIGDAIGLAVKRLRSRPGDRHVVILLTDGVNNSGEVEPIQAAELAADSDIIIYTVGVGANEMIRPGILGSSFGSRRVNPSRDLDEETLQKVADITGGKYFRAHNPEDLIEIYKLLDTLEPVEDEQETFRPQKALFYWPLALAIFISAFYSLMVIGWRELFSQAITTKEKIIQ